MAAKPPAKIKPELIERFAELFAGYEHAFGTYAIKKKEESGKLKGQAVTLKRAAKMEDWLVHLTGAGPGIGQIPLREDNTVLFAALDIDIKTIDHRKLEQSVKTLNYPLVVCRSKSGGAHLYLFLKFPVDAEMIRDRLADWAAELGYGGCEVFPKQSTRAHDTDYGNWINLPYFGGDDSPRKCIINGEFVELETFLIYAEGKKVKLDSVQHRKMPRPEAGDLFFEAPPCLQYLHNNGGFPEGTRNDGMFNIAVYAKKRFPDDWERKLSDYNTKMCTPTLMPNEINEIIKSVKRKDYQYKCKSAPIQPHCNKRECVAREYGVGESREGTVELGAVTRYVTAPGDPVKWGLEVAGRRIFVDNEILYSRDLFNRHCMAELGRIPIHVPPARWLKILDDVIASADTIQLPVDAGPSGILWEHVEMFCLQKAQAKTIDEVWTGRPFREEGVVFFRSVDLFNYLDKHRVEYDKNMQNVFHVLRDRGGKSEARKVGGKTMNLWSVPEPQAPEQGKTDTSKKPGKEDF